MWKDHLMHNVDPFKPIDQSLAADDRNDNKSFFFYVTPDLSQLLSGLLL
jgi:hypothetical protein